MTSLYNFKILSSAAQKRHARQQELMEMRLAEARRRMGLNGGRSSLTNDLDDALEGKELVTYRLT